MENNTEANLEPIVYSKKRKILAEIKDVLAGLAFPFMISLIFSASIIAYSAWDGDLAIKLLALIGGEIMFAGALIIFGRANGCAAYKKHLLYEQKRALNAVDEPVVYGTGEYKLWKGFLFGVLLSVPFVIFLTIQIAAPNTFCKFCLQYLFGWAYCPFASLEGGMLALAYLMILYPACVHALGYHLGKLQALKVQKALENQDIYSKKKGKKK